MPLPERCAYFSGNASATGANTTATFFRAGSYVLKVTIFDGLLTTTATVPVQVAQYFISPAGLIYAGVMVKTANAGDFIGAPDASTHNGHTSMYVSGSAKSIDVYEWNGTRRSTQFSVNTLTGSANDYVLGDYSYTSAAEYTPTTSATRSAGEQYFVYSFNFAAMNAET